jgi:hypothetical protein
VSKVKHKGDEQPEMLKDYLESSLTLNFSPNEFKKRSSYEKQKRINVRKVTNHPEKSEKYLK